MYAETSPALVSMIGSAVSEPAPCVVAQLRGALEQAAVEVEDVAGVRLTARRAAQQQRHLAVRLGLLRQVVVHDERVLAVVHPVLADRAPGVGARYLNTASSPDGAFTTTVYSIAPCSSSVATGLRDRRALLADGDVDALHAEAALVEDRVDRDRGLAGLAVADDELALTPADRGHGVDRLDAGLQRLVHRLAADDAGRLHLEAAQRCCSRSGPCRRWPDRARSPPDRRARRPTGTERMRPVAFTDWPSSISSAWPSTTHRSSSRRGSARGRGLRSRTRAAR